MTKKVIPIDQEDKLVYVQALSPFPNDPYWCKCKYELCLGWFESPRRNKGYCTPQHKNRQAVLVAMRKRAITATNNSLQYQVYLLLDRLYNKGIRERNMEQLVNEGFNPLAPYTRIVDENDGLVVLIYPRYGLKLIGYNQYRIIYLKNAALKISLDQCKSTVFLDSRTIFKSLFNRF